MSSAKGFPGQNGGWTQPRSPAVAGQEPDLAPANGYGQQGYGYMAPEMPISQMYNLEILFQGSLRVELRGAGVSCQDGHGNSYPCQ